MGPGIENAQSVLLPCFDACRLPIDQLIRIIRPNLESRRRHVLGVLVCDRNTHSASRPSNKRILTHPIPTIHGSVSSLTTTVFVLHFFLLVPVVVQGPDFHPISLFPIIHFCPISSVYLKPRSQSHWLTDYTAVERHSLHCKITLHRT